MKTADFPKPTDASWSIKVDEKDPSKKDKGYCLKKVRWLYYGSWNVWGTNTWCNSRRDEWITNRSYSSGSPNMNKYYNQIGLVKDDVTGELVSYMNMDLSPYTNIPKLRDIVVSRMEKMDFDMIATAINPEGVAIKRQGKFKLMAQKKLQDFQQKVNQLAQAQIAPEVAMPFEWETKEELDILYGMSAKLRAEMAMELGVQAVFSESDYDILRKEIAKDIFDCGCAVIDVITDENGRIKLEAVDTPNALMTSWQGTTDEQPALRGKTDTISLHVLKARGLVTDDDIKRIAALYANKFGNGNFMPQNGYVSSDNLYFDYWLSFKVPYVKYYWPEIDSYKMKRATRKRGEEAVNNYYPTTPDMSAGQITRNYTDESGYVRTTTIESEDVHYWYSACWVPNTDVIWSYGRVPNQARDPRNPRLALCPMKVIRVSTQPMCERLRPMEDQIILAELKLQNSIAKARPSGYSINIASLKNASIDGKEFTIKKQLQMLGQLGNLVWDSENPLDEFGREYPHPIKDLPSTFFNEIDGWMNIINFNLQMQRQVTGINEMMDGSTPNPKTLASTAKLAFSSSETALAQLASGFMILQKKAAIDAIEKLRIAVTVGGSYDFYSLVLGNSMVDILRLDSDVSNFRYDITMEPRSTEEERIEMKNVAAMAVQTLSDPIKGGLYYNDYIYIVSLINAGVNLKLIEAIMAQRIAKNIRKMAEMGAQNQQIQAQSTSELENQKMQNAILMEQKLSEIRMNEHKQNSAVDYYYQSLIITDKGTQKVDNDVVKNQLAKDKKTHEAMIDVSTNR